MRRAIEIVEVAPRDGLQNEAVAVSTADKIALIRRMAAAGARRIEIASFVRADRVPQMADAEAVVAGAALPDDVIGIGLVLNRAGLARALQTSVAQIGAVCIASDTFAGRNQNQTADGSVEMAAALIADARAAGRPAQATIGAAFGCPFEGEVAPARVVDMARRIADAGAVEVAVADTIGVAVPRQVSDLVARVRAAIAPLPVRVHLHNTRGTGIANAWAAIEAGAATLDASVGGIGGCPFASNATGNIATEELLYMLDRSDVATGLDLDAVLGCSDWLAGVMGRTLPALIGRAGRFPPFLPAGTRA
jgi:hydroxymethylglutaryl-CoA lyase